MRFRIIITVLGILLITLPLQATWTLQHTGETQINDIDLAPNNTDFAVACGNSGLIMRTTDGGTNWDSMTSPFTHLNFTGVSFPSVNNGHICTSDSGYLLSTVDAGVIWTYLQAQANTYFTGIHFPTENNGYACGLGGAVWRTFDGGLSWNNISLPELRNLHGIYFYDYLHGWIVGDNSFIARTYNGQHFFPAESTGVNARLLGVYFTDLVNGWAVGSGKTCLRTNDSGYTWTPVDIPGVPSNITFNSVVFPTSSYGFICGTSGWIARTSDGGNTWDAFALNPPHHFSGIDFPTNNDTGYICGSEEAIWKTTDGGGDWIAETNLPPPIGEKVFSCAPNPFRSNTIIKFGQSLNGNATLKLYDAKGELVRTLKLNKNDEVIWDGRNEVNQRVKSGVYLAELNHNGTTQRQKLIFMD